MNKFTEALEKQSPVLSSDEIMNRTNYLDMIVEFVNSITRDLQIPMVMLDNGISIDAVITKPEIDYMQITKDIISA